MSDRLWRGFASFITDMLQGSAQSLILHPRCDLGETRAICRRQPVPCPTVAERQQVSRGLWTQSRQGETAPPTDTPVYLGLREALPSSGKERRKSGGNLTGQPCQSVSDPGDERGSWDIQVVTGSDPRTSRYQTGSLSLSFPICPCEAGP